MFTSSTRAKLRRARDDKWAFMQDEEEEDHAEEEDHLMKILDEEGPEQEEDDGQSHADIADKTFDDMHAELQGLEKMIVAAQNLQVRHTRKLVVCAPRSSSGNPTV